MEREKSGNFKPIYKMPSCQHISRKTATQTTNRNQIVLSSFQPPTTHPPTHTRKKNSRLDYMIKEIAYDKNNSLYGTRINFGNFFGGSMCSISISCCGSRFKHCQYQIKRPLCFSFICYLQPECLPY